MRTLNWLYPSSRLTAWLIIAVGVALVICLLSGSVALAVAAVIILALLLVLSLIFAPLFVAVTVHEAGHMVAGWLVGFRFQSVRVASICVGREDNNIRVRWRNRASKRNRPLGFAQSLPSDDRNLRERIAAMIAGGPIANLLFGALCIGVARGIVPPASDDSPSVSVVTFLLLALPLFGWVSLAYSIANLFIWRGAEYWTDGAKLLSLLRGGEDSDLLCLRWALEGMAKNAVPVSQWPTSVIEKAAALGRGDGETGLLIMAYRWLLERGDVSSAGQFLTQVLTAEPSLSTALLARFWCEGAYLAARYTGTPLVARSFLKHAQAHYPVAGESSRRAEIAVSIAEQEGPASPEWARLRPKVVTGGRQAAGKQAEVSWIQELSALLSSTPPDPPAEATPRALHPQPSSDPS